MSGKVRIGLLSPFFVPLTGYEESAHHLCVDLVMVTPGRINWKTHEVLGLVYDGQAWTEDTVSLPPSLYNRYYGPKPKIVDRLETILGKNKVFNHVTRFDKWVIHQLLSKSKLKDHVPATAPYSPQQLTLFLERFGRVILKPTSGQLGTSIYLVAVDGGVYYLHYGTKSPIAHFFSLDDLLTRVGELVDQDFLVQEFLPLASVDGRVFDIRLLVQKNGRGQWQVTGMLSRLAMNYSYITNLSQAIAPVRVILGKLLPNFNVMAKLTELSIQAAQITEGSLGSLGEISVDFGLDIAGRVWIIELNAKPMKSTFEALGDPQLMLTIYSQPLHYALHLANS
jgi:glutathione synthase/RimK-type ligase-like ATP-grasp enzyme